MYSPLNAFDSLENLLMFKRLALVSLLILLVPLFLFSQDTDKVSGKFIFGYDFKTVQEIGGSLNSIKITLDTFAKKINSEFTLKMFKDSNELVTALDENKITCASLTPLSYVISAKKNIKPLVSAIGANSEDIFIRYIIVVRNDAEINTLDQLAGKSFAKTKSEETGNLYLSTELLKNKLKPIKTFFSNLPDYETQEEALYSVYFKKNMGCMISDDTLHMLIEMNPAIKDQMKIILKSEKYVYSGMFVNVDIPKELEENLINTSLAIHLTKSGRQTLKLVRTKKMLLVKDEDFNSIRLLLKEYKEISNNDYLDIYNKLKPSVD